MVWQILDDDFAPMASVLLPTEFHPLVFERCGVVGWQRAEFDVPEILRFAFNGTAADGLTCNAGPG